jgi:hypothetical protein
MRVLALEAAESLLALGSARLGIQRAARQLAEYRVESNRREPAQSLPALGGRHLTPITVAGTGTRSSCKTSGRGTLIECGDALSR